MILLKLDCWYDSHSMNEWLSFQKRSNWIWMTKFLHHIYKLTTFSNTFSKWWCSTLFKYSLLCAIYIWTSYTPLTTWNFRQLVKNRKHKNPNFVFSSGVFLVFFIVAVFCFSCPKHYFLRCHLHPIFLACSSFIPSPPPPPFFFF